MVFFLSSYFGVLFCFVLVCAYCRAYEELNVKHEPLRLIEPEFETPLPPLQPAVSILADTGPGGFLFHMDTLCVVSVFLSRKKRESNTDLASYLTPKK